MILAAWGAATFATLAVAGFTGVLALATWRLARGTVQETRANWRPVLAIEASEHEIPLPEGGAMRIEDSAVNLDEHVLTVGINNIGRGPAIRITAFLDHELEPDRIRRPKTGGITSSVAAPNGRISVAWENFIAPVIASKYASEGVLATIDGCITYWDVSYAAYATRFTLGFEPGEGGVDVRASLFSQDFLGIDETFQAILGDETLRQRVRRRLFAIHAVRKAARAWHQVWQLFRAVAGGPNSSR